MLLPATARAQVPTQAQAQPDIDFKRGAFGQISQYIGTYNQRAVLNDPAVRRSLGALLGEQNFRLLMSNLQVAGPIAFDGTALVLRGLRAHAGGEQEAFLTIRPSDGLMEVAILTAGRVRLISQRPSGERSEWLDPQLARWGVSRGVPLDERRVPPSNR